MRITLSSILVDDQSKALDFYTGKLGFIKKTDLPLGEHRWLTVVSPEQQEGPELVLEPMGFAPARTYQKALYEAGIPLTALSVDDVEAEFARLRDLGVNFSMEPTTMGTVKVAVLDDTCGNNIQLVEVL